MFAELRKATASEESCSNKFILTKAVICTSKVEWYFDRSTKFMTSHPSFPAIGQIHCSSIFCVKISLVIPKRNLLNYLGFQLESLLNLQVADALK